jgi:hypothetical protein
VTDTPKHTTDQAHFSPALIGFYACCAAVSAGAAMFFFACFVLSKDGFGAIPTVLKVLGVILVMIGIPGAFVCLGKARTPPSD